MSEWLANQEWWVLMLLVGVPMLLAFIVGRWSKATIHTGAIVRQLRRIADQVEKGE